jgi:hypothetical protein
VTVERAYRAVGTAIFNDVEPPPGDGSSDELGLYTDTATSRVSNDIGDHSDVTTSQVSMIRNGSLAARGSYVAAGSDDACRFLNQIVITFSVDQPVKYGLSMDFTYGEMAMGRADKLLALTLRNDTTSSYLVDQAYGSLGVVPHFSAAGELMPGQYTLAFDLHDIQEGPIESGSYKLNFTTGDGTGGPTAVPLPPAAYAGLLTLAGLAGAMAYSARRARAV